MFSPTSLTRIRERRGLTRSAVHRALVRRGLERCRSMVDRWESGRSEPSASEVEHIAAVLEVPIADLFTPVGTPT